MKIAAITGAMLCGLALSACNQTTQDQQTPANSDNVPHNQLSVASSGVGSVWLVIDNVTGCHYIATSGDVEPRMYKRSRGATMHYGCKDVEDTLK